MNDTNVLNIAVQMLTVTAKISAPILIVSMALGFAVSLVQAATQIHEVTLTFVPKLIGVALVIVVAGNWMLAELTSFTTGLFDSLPELLR